MQTYIHMQDLECSAHAASSQVETLAAGNALVQAEVDFFKNRLKLHMDAAVMGKQDIPTTAVPEGFGELRAALKAAKAAQDRLLQANKVLVVGWLDTE